MKKLWPLLIASAIGLIILCSLGTWQVFRLAEKNKMIAALEARMNAEPTSLADVLDRHAKGEDIEYVKVKARGYANAVNAIAKIATYNGKPGWEIIEPFLSEDGIFVLVDAGAASDKQVVPNTSDTLTGIIRLHKKGRGFFDNDNDVAANIWYWWDLPEMQAATYASSEFKIAPFVLQRLPADADKVAPFAQKPKVELKNNHLGYAITWFGLALALLGVSGFFARSLVKKADA
jgi:surfeit locus 1 family protein